MGSNTSLKLFPSLNSSTKKGSDRVSSVKIVAVIFRLFKYMMQSFQILFYHAVWTFKTTAAMMKGKVEVEKDLCTLVQ